MGRIWTLIKATFKGFSADRCTLLAAALAYYTIFSLAPVLVIVIAVASFFAGPQAASGELAAQLQAMMGPEGAAVVQTMVKNANTYGRGGLATLISLGVLVLSATALVSQLGTSLNIIWGAESSASGFLIQLRQRVAAFLMILGLGLVMFLFMAASATLGVVFKHFPDVFPGAVAIGLTVAEHVLSLAAAALLFAVIFKTLPGKPQTWRSVRAGAIFTAVLFLIGRILIGLYLGRKDMTVYGSAGSALVILLWIYYSSLILFLGAEFTKAWNEPRLGGPLDGRQ